MLSHKQPLGALEAGPEGLGMDRRGDMEGRDKVAGVMPCFCNGNQQGFVSSQSLNFLFKAPVLSGLCQPLG